MKTTCKSLFGGINVAALLAASAPIALALPSAPVIAAPAAPAAAAAPVYHCVPFVRMLTLPAANGASGGNPLFKGVAAQLFSTNVATVNQTAIPISGVPLSGPNGAGAICHADAIALFNGIANTSTYGSNGVSAANSPYINTNHVWSNPSQFCAQIFHNDGQQHFLGVYEIITEVGGPVNGHTGGYNQVGGYVAVCNSAHPSGNIPAPVVVPALP